MVGKVSLFVLVACSLWELRFLYWRVGRPTLLGLNRIVHLLPTLSMYMPTSVCIPFPFPFQAFVTFHLDQGPHFYAPLCPSFRSSRQLMLVFMLWITELTAFFAYFPDLNTCDGFFA